MANDRRICNKIAIYPTDTVWGIGASVFDLQSQKKIAQIKNTNFNKPNSVLFYGPSHLFKYLKNIPDPLKKMIKKKQFDLGLSVLIEKKNFLSIDKYIPETTDYVSIRILENETIRDLINDYFCGHPITSTSLNIHGESPIIDKEKASEFQKRFIDETFIYHSNELIPHGKSSTILQVDEDDKIQVLREGLNIKEILQTHGL